MTEFLGAGARQFGFMLRGLRELQPKLEALNIPFFLLKGAWGRRMVWREACGGPLGGAAAMQAAARALGSGRWSPLGGLGRDGAGARPPGSVTSRVPSPCPRPLAGDPTDTVPQLVQACGASLLVTDFAPLRLGRQWREGVAGKVTVPFHEVDAHNVVPVWAASGALRQRWRVPPPSSSTNP